MTDEQSPHTKPLDFLFSFKGGIGRGPFVAGLGVMVVLLICMMAAAASFMDPLGGVGLFIPITFALVILIAWIHAAIVVKRLRDAGRPGWYYVIFGLGPFLWLFLTLEFVANFAFLPFVVALVFLGLIVAPAFFPTKTDTKPAT